MSKARYPFSNTSFSAHEKAIYAMAIVIIFIATAIFAYNLTPPPYQRYVAMSIGGAVFAIVFIWVVILTTFNAKQISDRIHNLEHLEYVLIKVMQKIDRDTKMVPEDKRLILETYLEVLLQVDSETAREHLQKGDFDPSGALTRVIDEIRSEKRQALITKIDADRPGLYEATEALNELVENYRQMGLVIRTPKPTTA